jgi:hypothetical protein
MRLAFRFAGTGRLTEWMTERAGESRHYIRMIRAFRLPGGVVAEDYVRRVIHPWTEAESWEEGRVR